MFDTLRTIFLKEALDLLRDRRALFSLFAMPILLPIFYFVGGFIVVIYAAHETYRGLPVAIINGDRLPGLLAEFEEERALRLVDPPPDVDQALRNGELALVLTVPPDAAGALAAGRSITLTLTVGYGGLRTDLAVTLIQVLVEKYGDRVLTERLAQRGVEPSWLKPIHLQRVLPLTHGIAAAPTAGGEAVSAMLSLLFLPSLILLWAFGGGLELIAEMTIGEKARHTLETLLVTPADRVGLILGKVALSIVSSILVAGLLSLENLVYVYLLSMLPTLSGPATPRLVGLVGLSNVGRAAVWLMLLMAPLMVTVNGVMAAVCGFARSWREAGHIMTIIRLLLSGLAFLVVLVVDPAPPLGVYALPVIGVFVAVRDLWGGGIALDELILAWVGAAVCAVLAVLLAAYVFSRDWVLMGWM